MANFREVRKQFTEASVNKDLAALERIYVIVDDKNGDLNRKSETQTVDPGVMQKWNMLYDEVCTVLNRLRREAAKNTAN